VYSKVLSALAAAMLVAGLGISQSARADIQMLDGDWFQNRGPLIDIPVKGGPTICGPPGGTMLMTGCIGDAVPFKPIGGGIPKGPMTVTLGTPGVGHPTKPLGFTIPQFVFTTAPMVNNVPVANVNTVVQLDTHFSLRGPDTENGGPNPDRVFRSNAWVGQSGRLGQTFSWCPGVGGPNCTDPRPSINGNPGNENGRIKYSNPGGNGFGGTMSMLLAPQTPVGAVWVVVGTAGGPMNTPLLLKQPLNNAPGTQHPGGGYSVTDTDILQSGPIYLGFMTSMQTPGQTGLNGPHTGLITAMGPQIAAAPADNNSNYGMPWTTGAVLVHNIEQTNMGNNPSTTTISATGTDARTPAGEGNITLVAGGTTLRVGAVQNFPGFDIVTMTLPEPGAALMLGLSLSVIGGLYRLRRRF
jgi:hypothetical protein